jgi:prepilin-type N-terminal cleavage/methylation domain-containing protein
MKHFIQCIETRKSGHRRDGISLIEVIASMAIVGIMMVPISSVMRSSRQAISHVESRSAETDLRDGARWLRRLIQDNTLVETRSNVVVLKLATGDDVRIYVTRNELVMDNGIDAVVLMTDVLGAEFVEIKQSTASGKVTGVMIVIDILDPITGSKKSLTSVVSIPTQY